MPPFRSETGAGASLLICSEKEWENTCCLRYISICFHSFLHQIPQNLTVYKGSEPAELPKSHFF